MTPQWFCFGDYRLNPRSRDLLLQGERVLVPGKSLDCLCYLVHNRDRAVGRDELIAAVWGRVEVSDTVVSQTLLRLRRALGDTGDKQDLIRTVRGFGYHWVAPITLVAEVGSCGRSSATDQPPEEPDTAREANTSMVDSSRPPPARRRKKFRFTLPLTISMCVAVLSLGGLTLFHWRDTVSTERGSGLLLILPMRISGDIEGSSWLEFAGMELLANTLSAAGKGVVSSEETLKLLGSEYKVSRGPSDQQVSSLLEYDHAQMVLAPSAQYYDGVWSVSLDVFQRGSRKSAVAESTSPLKALELASDIWASREGIPLSKAIPSEMEELGLRIDAELLAGDSDAAQRSFETMPAAWRSEAVMLVRQGQIAFRRGNNQVAEQSFTRALRGGKNGDTHARALMGLGALASRGGNYGTAIERYTEAIKYLQAHSEKNYRLRAALGHALNGRGVSLIWSGESAAGLDDLGRARSTAQLLGNQIDAAMITSNMGQVLAKQGDYSAAINEFEAAEGVFHRFGIEDYLAVVLTARSEAEMSLLRVDAALRSASSALQLLKPDSDPALAADVHLALARHLLAAGRASEANALLDAKALSNFNVDAWYFDAKARSLLVEGKAVDALRILQGRPADAPATPSLCLIHIQVALAQGDIDSSMQWLTRLEHRENLEKVDASNAPSVAAAIGSSLIAAKRGDLVSAEKQAKIATELMDHSDSIEERAIGSSLLASILLDQGKFDDAQLALATYATYADSYGVLRNVYGRAKGKNSGQRTLQEVW